MKKLLYSLGALSTITPIFAVVACGDKETQTKPSTEDEQNTPTTKSGETEEESKTPSQDEAQEGQEEPAKEVQISKVSTLKIKVSSSKDNLAKIRDHVYVYKDAPVDLDKLSNGNIELQQLGLVEQDLIKNEIGINDSGSEFTFASQSLDNDVPISYTYNSTTSNSAKEVTIHYNYLSFESYNNATEGVVDKILSLDLDTKKEDINIDEWKDDEGNSLWKNDESKELFQKYLDLVDSFETAWYMTKFMKASTSFTAITQASFAINTETTSALTPEEKIQFLVNKIIIHGNMDIEETAKGIISRFKGEDTDFVAGVVQLGATVEGSKLIRGLTWSTAATAMGADDTDDGLDDTIIGYILDKIGYTLEDSTPTGDAD